MAGYGTGIGGAPWFDLGLYKVVMGSAQVECGRGVRETNGGSSSGYRLPQSGSPSDNQVGKVGDLDCSSDLEQSNSQNSSESHLQKATCINRSSNIPAYQDRNETSETRQYPQPKSFHNQSRKKKIVNEKSWIDRSLNYKFLNNMINKLFYEVIFDLTVFK